MYTFRSIVVVIFVFALCDGRKRYRCDYKYFSEIDAWLKLHEVKTNWREASLRCRLEGGHIASPTSVPLTNAMLSLLKENEGESIYIGIHGIYSNGDFHTVEGIPLRDIQHKWLAGEPSVYNNEQCIAMFGDKTLADTSCDLNYRYICYKQFKNHELMSVCGTIDKDYQLDTRTGSCYKFHTTPRTWSRAYMACAAEGGYLAIINSETEAQVIRDIYERNPDDSIVGISSLRCKGFAFIGFSDLLEHGDWLTVQDETLKHAGYDRFAPGEPNNSSDGEFCGSVTRDGLLNDLWCDNIFPFICEKSPDSLECNDDQ